MIDDKFELTSKKKENMIELSCETSLKQNFQNASLIQFSLDIKSEYDVLSNKTLKVLLPFLRNERFFFCNSFLIVE